MPMKLVLINDRWNRARTSTALRAGAHARFLLCSLSPLSPLLMSCKKKSGSFH